MATHLLILYLFAAIGLSLTPGPNSLLALTHGALHGHRKTLFTVAGGACGFVALIALSMLGIGALLKAWAAPCCCSSCWAGPIWSGWASSCGARRRSSCGPAATVWTPAVLRCFARAS